LNKNNITYWVDFGTLLGIHRDRDIILGDNDADICIPSTEEDKLLKAFQNTGSTFKKWRRMHWPAFRTYSFFFVDLYLITFDLEKQMVIIPDSPETPMNLLNSFEETTMYVGKSEITFTQPVEWKKLLVFRYGKKWIENTNKWYLGYMSFFDTKNPRN
jgi:phosphorylcholine metabolism protein LicD